MHRGMRGSFGRARGLPGARLPRPSKASQRMPLRRWPAYRGESRRLVKSQYSARRPPIEVSIFNEPIFQQQSGLNQILRIFGEDALQPTLKELNQTVFVR